jgi:hypothetical protein
MHSIEHKVFSALVATNFGRYDSHQANAIQNVKYILFSFYPCFILSFR